MPSLPNPVIVLPGITASHLADDYPVPAEPVWTVLTKAYERVQLHPDDLRYEAVEPARVVPGQIYEIAYRELIEELRYNLRRREDEPVPVFAFPYDWRQPLEAIEDQLAAVVDEVCQRTRLLRHYDRDGYADDPKVNLVGHSMGGLIIAGYLARRGGNRRIGKVATLATPFQGSFEAVIKVTTGTADLGGGEPSSREREAARLTPALYYLIPSFPGAIVTESDGLPDSLFQTDAWQVSIVDTITQYVRLHGLGRRNQKQQAQEIFEALLRQAAAHRQRTNDLELAAAGLSAADWLCVAGVDSETRVVLELRKLGSGVDLVLKSEHRKNEWPITSLTGDGTVPLEGAVPPFLAREQIVCVRPNDYGYWEVQDRLTSQVAGFHGIMPNMNMLHRLIVRHFTGSRDTHGNTWGRGMPGVDEPTWQPPLKLNWKD